MKKVIFTLLCILFAFSNLFSQPDSTNQELTDKEINEIILDIRNRYNEVNNIETLREENELFDIFYHVTKINWADTTEGFPGVGHKHSTFTFHTIKDQTFKLIHSYQIAEYGGIKEYYFDDENGSLIFYFFKKFEGEGEESDNEQRLYFHNNELIHFQIRPRGSNEKEARNYRLDNLKEEHFSIANKVLKESAFRVKWFPESFK